MPESGTVFNKSLTAKTYIMKKEKNFSKVMLVLLAALISGYVAAQEPKNRQIEIRVSSQCSMCKETIERTLAFEKGVVKANLDLETDVVTVVYKTARTTPEKIREAISKAGYDADDVAADPKAYNDLPDCCKKPEDQQHDHSGHKH
jgi:copper chaperone CopZ